MIKKIILLFFAITLIGCAHHNSVKQKVVMSAITTERAELPPFSAIVVAAPLRVNLTNGSNAISITGTQQQINNTKLRIINNVLYIDKPGASGQSITVSAPFLKVISVADNASIISSDYKTEGLTVVARDNGSINLKGIFGINSIAQQGTGKIEISWVESGELAIDSNEKGPIKLSGMAKNVVARLMGEADLDARYLRIKKASIITSDTARADVLAIDQLRAYATDHSNIYYYKYPHKISVVTRKAGNVLHPDWIH